VWVVDDSLPFGDDHRETLPMEIKENEIPAAVAASLMKNEKNDPKNAKNARALAETSPPHEAPSEVTVAEAPELPDLSQSHEPVPDPTRQSF